MSTNGASGRSLLATTGRAIGVLLLVALGARLIWELLLPLLPALGTLLVLTAIGGWLLSRRQW